MRGRFISFEGIDGSGKSLQAKRLTAWLEEKGVPVLLTREPGGSDLGEGIRSLLLSKPMSAVTELLLLTASRRDHCETVIQPALKKGIWVISDRFIDSSFAYQVVGRGVSQEHFKMLSEAFLEPSWMPDHTFFLTLSEEDAFLRRKHRSYGEDRIEKELVSMYKRIEIGYCLAAELHFERAVSIDGSKTPDKVAEQIQSVLSQMYTETL